MGERFAGFPAQMRRFLAELEDNNAREWFEANRQRYEDCVREPARAFIRNMAPHIDAISPFFVADDRKVGGSLMRIHRDVRFSRDKRPYKTNVGIQFRHEDGKDVHAPGFYVHIAPKEIFIGVGAWAPDAAALALMRSAIAAQPQRWKRIITAKQLVSHFSPGGESLKRPPRGYDADHPLIDELKRKSFVLMSSLKPSAITKPGFDELVAARFANAKRYVGFLCEALDIAF